MVNPLISVLVPVYNGQKFLPKLIDSLENQTYTNFEVIMVDDFSTDKSTQIILDQQAKDSRFRERTKEIRRWGKQEETGSGG